MTFHKLLFIIRLRKFLSTLSNYKGYFVVNLPGASAEVTADTEGTVGTVDWGEGQCSAEDGDGPKMKTTKTTTKDRNVRCHSTFEKYTVYFLNKIALLQIACNKKQICQWNI